MSPPPRSQQRLLLRTAATIQAQYAAHADRPSLFTLPHSTWDECVRATQLLGQARRRKWRHAADELTFRIRNACRSLAHEVGQLEQLLKPRTPPQRTPTLRDLYADLVALHDEYENVRIDRRAGVLAVTTAPIELEGIDLGPFEIQLRCSALPDARCYSVIALQPHASGSEGYVHPHVQHEHLCEGEGRLPIQRALADGRLCDFFQIVTRILESYNAESAYVQLDNWDGRDCSSCGDSISGDDAYECSRCGTSLCFDCYQRCNRCDELFCNECVTPCASCDDVYCRSCLTTCPECEGDCCAKCRPDDQRCSDCGAEEADEEPAAAVDTSGSTGANPAEAAVTASPSQAEPYHPAAAAVLTHSLGQAGVPA